MGRTEALTFTALTNGYRDRVFTVSDVVHDILDRIDADRTEGVFTQLASRAQVAEQIRNLSGRSANAPLYGLPFVVKDNIDVAGFATTAACPAYGYVAKMNAPVVQRLLDAGAICLAKTNMDQFATGLVGTRSPYGVPRNPFHPDYIAGGSSSGSAVAVGLGYAAFALGTDTAGSGRVPAAFNNIVGFKPTRGMLSTRGVVPACASLDCVSTFALTVRDAALATQVMSGHDAAHPYSAPEADAWTCRPPFTPERPQVGVPRAEDRQFFGDSAAEADFAAACARATALGWQLREVNLAPFHDAASLLYEGAFVAQRLEAAGELLATSPHDIEPTVRAILERSRTVKASDVFASQRRLALCHKNAHATFAAVDALLLPTTPTIFTRAAVAADPIATNAQLGTYTNFVNLLDLCGVAVPSGFRADGLPAGVTVIARAGNDVVAAALAEQLHHAAGLPLASTSAKMDAQPRVAFGGAWGGWTPLVVVGAHMTDGPLNHELTARGAIRVDVTQTAPVYRLYALAGEGVQRPGLVRVAEAGVAIEAEVWAMRESQLGSFFQKVPSPLGLGRVAMSDGRSLTGFLCEGIAVQDARDVSSFGGWRAYLSSISAR